MLPHKKFIIILSIILIGLQTITGGDVYLVIGSDTAIWEGMNTNRFHCFYNVDLYTNPQRNAYKVMDPNFRAKLIDSDGQPLKMTWWMMAGNIFRYATNTNVPIPNIMTMYLMKTYHGNEVLINGDELTLHYHTFKWYDYNGDGIYYWNQALSFMDSFDDFNYTLAQYLLEEQVFPVSFRSGWHYMDNDWQHYLDNFILPYSMHNAYPFKHNDTTEPIDNIYDWSQAPSAFVPFRPSPENYQRPGNGKGWNVRSVHYRQVIHDGYLDTVFSAAQKGQDQVACFWGHLPENDFVTNIEKIDSIAHARIGDYPDVKFHYCTAIEAMQKWRHGGDTTAPKIDFEAKNEADGVYFTIHSDEPIFQQQPFVAVKDVYEDYHVLNCSLTGTNTWRTNRAFPRDILAKAGVAVCDTFGNQTIKLIRLLPDDAFIDNQSDQFQTLAGNWQTFSSGTPWATDALQCILQSETDSAVAEWQYNVHETSFYNVFVQVPKVSNPAKELQYLIMVGSAKPDTIRFRKGVPPNTWQYLKTLKANAGETLTVRLKALGAGQSGKAVLADVVKISAMVRERDLQVDPLYLNFGAVGWGDTVRTPIKFRNSGKEALTISRIAGAEQNVFCRIRLPLIIPAMSDTSIDFYFHSKTMGDFSDSLTIESNDPRKPKITLPVTASVQNYFKIVDNDDSAHYKEYGEWHTSNAQAYGPSSRYAWLNRTPVPYARFTTMLKKSGVYEVSEIVPKTKNATDKALYEISIDGVPIDSVYLNQNQGSGSWVPIGRYYLPADINISVRVIDSRQSTVGEVLRADAIKFSLIKEITDLEDLQKSLLPSQFLLAQNFPNPFNATTTIRYHLPEAAQVQVVVFNVLGRRVRILTDRRQQAGWHQLTWDGRNDQGVTVSSGIYYYRLRCSKFTAMKKMILLK